MRPVAHTIRAEHVPGLLDKPANSEQRFHFRTRRQELNSVEGGMSHPWIGFPSMR